MGHLGEPGPEPARLLPRPHHLGEVAPEAPSRRFVVGDPGDGPGEAVVVEEAASQHNQADRGARYGH